MSIDFQADCPAKGLGATLREFIRQSGLSTYALGRDAEVDPGAIQRFLSGERDLRLETAARIAATLGLDLVASARPGESGLGPAPHRRGSRSRATCPVVFDGDGR